MLSFVPTVPTSAPSAAAVPAATAARRGNSRERILAIAAERFQIAGYVETSLRDLARDAGMKAGSLYYHFDSKDQLFEAVLERGMEIMVDAFDRAAEMSVGRGSEDVLRAHVEAHLRALHENLPYTAGHVTLFRTAPANVRNAVVPLRDGYELLWTGLLARLLPDREPSEINMLRLTLFGAMNASIDWFDTGRGSVGPFAHLITEQFWFGVAPEGDGQPQKGSGQ